MRHLRTHREGWDEVEHLSAAALRQLGVAESVAIFRHLCDTFAQQLEATSDLFDRPRRRQLAQLQERLMRLSDWEAAHDTGSDPEHSGTPTATV